MIKKLPLGVSGFADVRRYPGYLYVDKTQLLADLFPRHGLEKRHLFLAQPRRFGKTLRVSTREALCQGRQKLFAGPWIGQAGHWDGERNRSRSTVCSSMSRRCHSGVSRLGFGTVRCQWTREPVPLDILASGTTTGD